MYLKFKLSLEIKDAIHASFSFLKEEKVVSSNFYFHNLDDDLYLYTQDAKEVLNIFGVKHFLFEDASLISKMKL